MSVPQESPNRKQDAQTAGKKECGQVSMGVARGEKGGGGS